MNFYVSTKRLKIVSFLAILKNHLLPNVICSAALGPKSRTKNMLEDYLMLQRNQDNQLSVQDSKVLEKDIMATNGVIYVVDKPLIPSEGKIIVYRITEFTYKKL